MFTGEVRHQLDAKNRIRIPSRFKAELGDSYYFVKGHDCICVYRTEVLDKIVEELKAKIDRYNPTQMKKLRAYTRTMMSCSEDNQGRIVVDKLFLSHANLKKDIVTIGVVDHLEIVSAELIEEQDETTFSDVMELFSQITHEKND